MVFKLLGFFIRGIHAGEPKWPNIKWHDDINKQIDEWFKDIGFCKQQIERYIVHLLHLKRTIIKLKKSHKDVLKQIFNKEVQFISENTYRIMDGIGLHDKNSRLSKWYAKISRETGLSVHTIKLCSKEILMSLSALAFDDNTEYDESQVGQSYCACETEFDFDKPMLPCSTCEEHYHYECMQLTYEQYCEQIDAEVITWKCGQKEGCK